MREMYSLTQCLQQKTSVRLRGVIPGTSLVIQTSLQQQAYTGNPHDDASLKAGGYTSRHIRTSSRASQISAGTTRSGTRIPSDATLPPFQPASGCRLDHVSLPRPSTPRPSDSFSQTTARVAGSPLPTTSPHTFHVFDSPAASDDTESSDFVIEELERTSPLPTNQPRTVSYYRLKIVHPSHDTCASSQSQANYERHTASRTTSPHCVPGLRSNPAPPNTLSPQIRSTGAFLPPPTTAPVNQSPSASHSFIQAPFPGDSSVLRPDDSMRPAGHFSNTTAYHPLHQRCSCTSPPAVRQHEANSTPHAGGLPLEPVPLSRVDFSIQTEPLQEEVVSGGITGWTSGPTMPNAGSALSASSLPAFIIILPTPPQANKPLPAIPPANILGEARRAADPGQAMSLLDLGNRLDIFRDAPQIASPHCNHPSRQVQPSLRRVRNFFKRDKVLEHAGQPHRF
jgi:hypothetical protein